ncbi:flagellar basal body protein [bacterium]|nr:flagellar basal body protein [bacterium]
MLGTLNVSQTGLNAAKVLVENVSNNISNQNTEGYKKRVVQVSELEQMDTRFTGRGVNASSSYRVTSQYMYDKLTSENTKSNYYDKLSNMIGSIESIFAETEDSGFSSDLNRYFQSIENLRTNPNSEVYKTTLKNSGNNIVESLQNLYTTIESQQLTEKKELEVNVDKVNSLLKEIGAINEKLEKYDTVSNDLLDKRDQLEFELSNYVDISVGRNNEYYELKIAGNIAISNNTNIRTFTILENNTNQIDKFYDKQYNADKTFNIIDPIKSNYDTSTDTITPRSFVNGDSITYKINNEYEVSVTIGDNLTADWDNDSTTADTTQVIDINNLTRALVLKINANADTKNLVTAYNGDYSLDSKGNKILNTVEDKFLRIESKFPGTQNQFDGRISVNIASDTNKTALFKNQEESKDPESTVAIGIFDKEITLKSGIIKAQVDNLSSSASNNKYQSYLDKLNSFAKTLADISDKFVKTGTNTYIYGDAATDASATGATVTNIGLFNGLNIKDLKFNESAVNDLNQEKLDYLATLQWKDNISFDGLGQNNGNSGKSISFLEFFRDIKVGVSADKENNDFLKETQNNVKQSLKSAYDQLTKVDNDEEMLNLIKFQAAYTANAKIITVIDEMLQTLLGLKR